MVLLIIGDIIDAFKICCCVFFNLFIILIKYLSLYSSQSFSPTYLPFPLPWTHCSTISPQTRAGLPGNQPNPA